MLRNSFQGSSLWFISKDYVIVPHLFKLQNFYKFASIPPFPMAFDKTAINPPACFPNKRIFYTVLSVSFDTLCYHKFFTCSRGFFYIFLNSNDFLSLSTFDSQHFHDFFSTFSSWHFTCIYFDFFKCCLIFYFIFSKKNLSNRCL